jgi:hypothetical protein
MHAVSLVAAFIVCAVTPSLAWAAPGTRLEVEGELDIPGFHLVPEHGKAGTADASPVSPGSFELEVGYAPVWSDAYLAVGLAQPQVASTHGLTVAAATGLVTDVDVKLSTVFATTYDGGHLHADGSAPKEGSGVGDLRLGARWRFLSVPRSALELAVIGETVVPVGTRHTATQIGLSQEFWSGRLALAGTMDLGRATFNVELGYMSPLAGKTEGARPVFQANLAAGYHLSTWLQPEVEVNYQRSVGTDAHVLAVTAGIVAPWGAASRIVARRAAGGLEPQHRRDHRSVARVQDGHLNRRRLERAWALRDRGQGSGPPSSDIETDYQRRKAEHREEDRWDEERQVGLHGRRGAACSPAVPVSSLCGRS